MTMPTIELPTNMTENTKWQTIIREALIAHDTRLQDLRNDAKELRKDIDVLTEATLAGNPTTGLLSHSERIRELEKYADSIKETIRYWGRLIGGALLLNFLGFMTGIVVAVLQFLPLLKALVEAKAQTP
jgi:hypothetical protein